MTTAEEKTVICQICGKESLAIWDHDTDDALFLGFEGDKPIEVHRKPNDELTIIEKKRMKIDLQEVIENYGYTISYSGGLSK